MAATAAFRVRYDLLTSFGSVVPNTSRILEKRSDSQVAKIPSAEASSCFS